MRRSHGGWLAALVLLVSGCASGPDGNDAASVSREAIVVPTLAVADRAPAPVPMEQIAEASGFLSMSSFYNSFKKVEGTTPAAWRQAQPLVDSCP